MDIVSHGLWGSIAFGRKSRSSFWIAFVIGMAPDIFSFGILSVAAVLGLSEQPDFSHGTPPESTIPQYVHHLYNVTHSFLVFLAVFFLVWFLLKRPLLELCGWGLHVLVDPHAFVCVLPDTGLLATLRLDIQRLAMDDSQHPHFQLCATGPALCMVFLADL